MSGFDLIPDSYRAARGAKDSLRTAAIAASIVVLVGVLAGVALRFHNAHEAEQLATLTIDSNARAVVESKYKLMAAARKALREQGTVLEALQRRGATTALIGVVEQARQRLPLWLKRWDYASSAGSNSSAHRMQLRGDAQNHAALTQFVDALLAAPAVADVRIAAANERGRGSNIDFQLELELVAL